MTAFGYASLKQFMNNDEIGALKSMAEAGDLDSWTEGMKKGHELQMAKLFHERAPAMEYALLSGESEQDSTAISFDR